MPAGGISSDESTLLCVLAALALAALAMEHSEIIELTSPGNLATDIKH